MGFFSPCCLAVTEKQVRPSSSHRHTCWTDDSVQWEWGEEEESSLLCCIRRYVLGSSSAKQHPIASRAVQLTRFEKMFIRFSTLLPVAALVAVAAAAPSALEARQSSSQCNTGPIQCCNSTQEVGSVLLTLPPFVLTMASSRTQKRSASSVDCSDSCFPPSRVSSGSAATRSRSSVREPVLLAPRRLSAALTTSL